MKRKTYEILLKALARQLADNERDIQRECAKLIGLMAERQTIKQGIAGIEEELEAWGE